MNRAVDELRQMIGGTRQQFQLYLAGRPHGHDPDVEDLRAIDEALAALDRRADELSAGAPVRTIEEAREEVARQAEEIAAPRGATMAEIREAIERTADYADPITLRHGRAL